MICGREGEAQGRGEVFLGRRLKQLANERERLLTAYYADALDVATLKREQARINAEVA